MTAGRAPRPRSGGSLRGDLVSNSAAARTAAVTVFRQSFRQWVVFGADVVKSAFLQGAPLEERLQELLFIKIPTSWPAAVLEHLRRRLGITRKMSWHCIICNEKIHFFVEKKTLQSISQICNVTTVGHVGDSTFFRLRSYFSCKVQVKSNEMEGD